MKETFNLKKIFNKDPGNLERLRLSLESKKIDKDLVPILEKFLSLPITPRESCYGHPEKRQSPYFSYIEDETQDEKEKNFQQSFKAKISVLSASINQAIGNEVVNVQFEETDYGGGPKDFTIYFEIIDKKYFQAHGEKLLATIWEEFSKCIN